MHVSNQTRTRRFIGNPEVIGPYSSWPRQTRTRPVRNVAASGTAIVAAAVFVHCVTPLI